MRSLEVFKRWVDEYSYRRGIVCHFYISRPGNEEEDRDDEARQVQYFTKVDYAFFNLFNQAKEWIIKGTPHNGVRDKYGDPCRVPCLNCFEVNKKFLKALKELGISGNSKFEIGVLFNKRGLRSHFGSDDVCDVDDWMKSGCPELPNKQCWRYDIPWKKKGVLDPFNFCDVVRVRTRKSSLRRLPIHAIPIQHIVGLLVRKSDHKAVLDSPKSIKYTFEVFPVL